MQQRAVSLAGQFAGHLLPWSERFVLQWAMAAPAPRQPIPADCPDRAMLRSGRTISLARLPATPEAHALVDAVLAAVVVVTAGRTVGPGRRATLRQELGRIVGGLLRGAARGGVVSAALGRSADMWEDAELGWRAFWTKADAMQAAVLIGKRDGTGGHGAFGGFTGYPTRLWATPRLLDMAATCGVGLGDLATHWPIPAQAQTVPVVLDDDDLVRVAPLAGWTPPPGYVPTQAAMETVRGPVRRLNAHVASAAITGAVFPVFRRKFLGCLQLGGRLYARADTFQNVTKEERKVDTRINGERTAEVDATASQLSVFLALSGRRHLPADPYAIPLDVPRAVVKQACIEGLGAGRLLRRWSDRTPPKVAAFSLSPVRAALLTAYPELADISSILPPELHAHPPPDPKDVQWAAGQFLVFVESEIIGAALHRLMDDGVVGLPIFDGLVVQASAAEQAREALSAAYLEQLGVPVRVTVKAG